MEAPGDSVLIFSLAAVAYITCLLYPFSYVFRVTHQNRCMWLLLNSLGDSDQLSPTLQDTLLWGPYSRMTLLLACRHSLLYSCKEGFARRLLQYSQKQATAKEGLGGSVLCSVGNSWSLSPKLPVD